MNIKKLNLIMTALIVSGTVFGQQVKQKELNGNQIIAMIKANVTCPWSEETVDTFKSGNPEDIVSGIAVCMFADMKVLKQAVADKCNLIIAHEPTFYSHTDQTKSLVNDLVYQEKIKYINDNKLIIWRFHDHIHRTKPDGIYFGMVEKLGWRKYQSDSSMIRFTFGQQKLSAFISNLKTIFPGSSLRVIGNTEMKVTNVALSLGAPGFETHLKLLQETKTDLLIAGEAPEWETYQYVHDACLQDRNKAVIFLGHTNSEEGGMKYCARWLKGFLPQNTRIQYIENGSGFNNF